MRRLTSVVCRSHFARILTAVVVASAISGSPASGATLYGTLSNFDVVNDTGEVCHGFEIELEGVNPSDIAFTFGAPYIRYGDPVLVSTGTGTGTIVRYASTFGPGGWTTGTPIPSGPFPTGGHQCFYPAFGGDLNYETLGGEHFGVALNGNPTNTIYRWLLGDAKGNLTPAGTTVKIPAPVWKVVPPPPANPVAPVAVQAVLPALPKENPGDLFGEAMWVKVFVTEAAEPVELNELLPGEPAVPDGSDPAEVEIEWILLQAGKNNADELDSGLNDLAEGSESITRRYEFYKYTGPYDEEGEALVEDPADDPNAVGEFLGSQNAALNLQPFGVPEAGTFQLLFVACLGLAATALVRMRQRSAVEA